MGTSSVNPNPVLDKGIKIHYQSGDSDKLSASLRLYFGKDLVAFDPNGKSPAEKTDYTQVMRTLAYARSGFRDNLAPGTAPISFEKLKGRLDALDFNFNAKKDNSEEMNRNMRILERALADYHMVTPVRISYDANGGNVVLTNVSDCTVSASYGGNRSHLLTPVGTQGAQAVVNRSNFAGTDRRISYQYTDTPFSGLGPNPLGNRGEVALSSDARRMVGLYEDHGKLEAQKKLEATFAVQTYKESGITYARVMAPKEMEGNLRVGIYDLNGKPLKSVTGSHNDGFIWFQIPSDSVGKNYQYALWSNQGGDKMIGAAKTLK